MNTLLKSEGKKEIIFLTLWHFNPQHFIDQAFEFAMAFLYDLSFKIHIYAFPLLIIHSFDNDDMKSSKRHVLLVSLIILLKDFFKPKSNVFQSLPNVCSKQGNFSFKRFFSRIFTILVS